MTRYSVGMNAITWMQVFKASDFPDFASTINFLLNLRIAIPPVLAILEILNYQFNETTTVTSIFLYRIGLIGSYLLALRIGYPSQKRMLITFLVSIIFIYGTAITHPGNPQVYDILYPFFVLLSVYFLKQAENTIVNSQHPLFCLLAGFFLSMAELTRPFFILILPFVLISAWAFLRKLKRFSFVLFLLPIILFSGVWHTMIGLRFGQIFWSNTGGVSLWRAWKEYYQTDPMPLYLVEETNNRPLVDDGRWENINTPERTRNSNELQRGIITWWGKHPIQFLVASIKKLLFFFSTPTKIYNYDPQSPYLFIFRYLVNFAFLFLFVSGLVLGVKLIEDWKTLGTILANQSTLLIIVTIPSVLVLSLTEKYEEIRLIISLLPLLAVFPLIIGKTSNSHVITLNKFSQGILAVIAVLFLLVVIGGMVWTRLSPIPTETVTQTLLIFSALVAGILSVTMVFYNIRLSSCHR